MFDKIKDYIENKQAPITKDYANMLAFTGKVCTLEERYAEFIKRVNEIIFNKSRASIFICLVEVPEELTSYITTIKNDFIERGFKIHELTPVIYNVFVINWR